MRVCLKAWRKDVSTALTKADVKVEMTAERTVVL